MILKSFQLNNLPILKTNFFLFYGENEGLKNEAIETIINSGFSKTIQRYDESEVLNNFDNFINETSNKSLFEDKKIIIISRSSDKIRSLIDEMRIKNFEDIKLIINCGMLEKKSKLRSIFEKEKNLICVPFYNDDNKTLANLASSFFNKNKISISREVINLIVERSRGDRINLNSELSKIEAYLQTNKVITHDEVLKLTNLAENYSFSELADSCLSKNKRKTINIINENNYTSEDCISIIRVFLIKAKRILRLKKINEINNNIEKTISDYKPPYF
jgi:DNA polymerase III, delta subunit